MRLLCGSGLSVVQHTVLSVAVVGLFCVSSLSGCGDKEESGTTTSFPDVPGGDNEDVMADAAGGGTGASTGNTGEPYCGDGICQDDESLAACPDDCKASGGEPSAGCIEANCDTEWCEGDLACGAALDCVGQCSTEECAKECIQGAPDNVFGRLRQIVQCAVQSECLEPSDGPGPGPGPNNCGDGTCGPDENPNNCPEDCGGGNANEAYECLVNSCDTGPCPNIPPCNAILECLADCNNSQCVGQCMQGVPEQLQGQLSQLIECGASNQCIPPAPGGGPGPGPGGQCGNGSCDGGESADDCPEDCDPNGGTCEGKCGQFAPNQPCHCDEQCVQFENCCDDYFEECVEGPGPGPDNEIIECLIDECEAGQCADAPICGGAIECMGKCADLDCAEECLEDQPQQNLNFLVPMLECAAQNSCLEKGGGPIEPTCGNGKCEEGENQDNCAEDCAAEPECGNGKCEPGENKDNCAADCGGTNPPSGYECIVEQCETGICESIGACKEVLVCMGECADEECAEDCLETLPGFAQDLLDSVVECAVDSNCLAGGTPGSTCGDGQCADDENLDSCPEDCATATWQCLVFECGATECADAPICSGALECMSDCTTLSCAEECLDGQPNNNINYLQPVLSCAVDNDCLSDAPVGPVCGNGECEQGEGLSNCPEDCKPGPDQCGNGNCDGGESADDCPQDCNPDGGSCAGQCGQFNGNGAPCHCDDLCVEFNNCCSDYKSECQGGGPNDPYTCMIESCNVGGCLGNDNCKNTFICVSGCTNDDCVASCLQGKPNWQKNLLNNVYACGVEAGCVETTPSGPECGNGECEDGETADSCPGDCAGGVDPSICVYQACSDAITTCTQSFDCTKGLQCMDNCNGALDCATECADGDADLLAVIECGQGAGCIN